MDRRPLLLNLAPTLIVLTLSALALPLAARGKPPVVESVEKGGGAEVAGLLPGEELLAWERGEASGALASVFDWLSLMAEQQPRGPVRLEVRGKGGTRWVELPAGPAKVTVRPALRGADLRGFLEGSELLGAGDAKAAAGRWEKLASRWDARGKDDLAAWLRTRQAIALQGKRLWSEALEAREAALGDAAEVPHPEARFTALEGLGLTLDGAEEFGAAGVRFEELEAYAREAYGESLHLARAMHLRGYAAWKLGKLADAEGHYLRALALRERFAPDSSDTGATLNNLGIVYDDLGDLRRAREIYERAFALKERLDPGGVSATMTLNNLGVVSARLGDFDAAERYYGQALERYQRLDPDGPRTASTLANLGRVLRDRGDGPRAEEVLSRALALKEKLVPGTQSHAASLTSLGVLCHNRGDLTSAEDYYRRALDIRMRVDPESVDTALLVNNLGLLAQDRLDYPEAEARFRESLALIEKQAPAGPDAALLLSNLSVVVGRMGRFGEAEELARRAYALRMGFAPDAPDTADSLINLSWLARERGGLDEALELGSQALALQERVAPGCLHRGPARTNLGVILEKRGDLEGAEAQYAEAARILAKLAPGSSQEATALYHLGKTRWERGNRDGAAQALFAAVEALETQKERLGGTEEAQAGFTAGYSDYYRDLILLLLEMRREGEAYAVLERSRARDLLHLLAHRDLVFSKDLPEDLERRRREVAARYDQALRRLGELAEGDDGGALDAARADLAKVRREREELRALIAEASPKLAALQYPVPLDLKGALATLDDGTLLLAYCVGREGSVLFALGPGPGEFGAWRLAVGQRELGVRARRLVALLEDRQDATEAASRLGEDLLGPARDRIRRAKRLLLSPDGPLHVLPFAALGDPTPKGGFRYLAEAKPLHTVLSATLYAELTKGRREGRETQLAAFGDPRYPPADDARSQLRGGAVLTPLPGTREEVGDLGRLYGQDARLLLGAEATEGASKALGRDLTLVHFACHGFLDGDFPLDSALALTIPDAPGPARDNGLLQAWEVFESVRLDADLVALSACETGLGKEMGGEGLVGMTRAFQYAGARTVLASLWKVPDAATALLMRGFYARLREGKPKDEALREAQRDFLEGRVRLAGEGARTADLAHPFYWAGFVLAGDWR